MGNSWGADNFRTTYSKDLTVQQNRLTELISEFPSGLKQAMFAAASHGNIRRRTWNGCALNAAGLQENQSVSSIDSAASVFGITPSQAKIFITNWDALQGSDEDCTVFLREAIEKAGLFLEPGERPPKIIRFKVYENQQKKLREQFDQLMEANMIPDVDAASFLLETTDV